MAKSSRSSVQKRNKAKLRATVFGPAADARTARLSAKLHELASQPRPKNSDAVGMEVDGSAGMSRTLTGLSLESTRQDKVL
jgi:hypothetical protein